MKAREFCSWLDGLLHGEARPLELSEVEAIKARLVHVVGDVVLSGPTEDGVYSGYFLHESEANPLAGIMREDRAKMAEACGADPSFEGGYVRGLDPREAQFRQELDKMRDNLRHAEAMLPPDMRDDIVIAGVSKVADGFGVVSPSDPSGIQIVRWDGHDVERHDWAPHHCTPSEYAGKDLKAAQEEARKAAHLEALKENAKRMAFGQAETTDR